MTFRKYVIVVNYNVAEYVAGRPYFVFYNMETKWRINLKPLSTGQPTRHTHTQTHTHTLTHTHTHIHKDKEMLLLEIYLADISYDIAVGSALAIVKVQRTTQTGQITPFSAPRRSRSTVNYGNRFPNRQQWTTLCPPL